VLGLVLAGFACSALLEFLPFFASLSAGSRTIVLTVIISAGGAILFPVKYQEVQDDDA